MSAEAISRVTMALKTRLQAALAAASDPGNVFVGPLDDLDAGGASLILFLYRIVPSPTLRNRERRVAAINPPTNIVTYRDSLPLDLYYLVTVGTRPGITGEEPLLRVLGFAMRELQNAPDLVGAGVGNEAIHVSLEPLTTDEVSRVWTLFPAANYRTSIAYLATPVWIDPAAPPPPAAPVVVDDLLAGQHA